MDNPDFLLNDTNFITNIYIENFKGPCILKIDNLP